MQDGLAVADARVELADDVDGGLGEDLLQDDVAAGGPEGWVEVPADLVVLRADRRDEIRPMRAQPPAGRECPARAEHRRSIVKRPGRQLFPSPELVGVAGGGRSLSAAKKALADPWLKVVLSLALHLPLVSLEDRLVKEPGRHEVLAFLHASRREERNAFVLNSNPLELRRVDLSGANFSTADLRGRGQPDAANLSRAVADSPVRLGERC